jgi:trimeric autotransporter adhesin
MIPRKCIIYHNQIDIESYANMNLGDAMSQLLHYLFPVKTAWFDYRCLCIMILGLFVTPVFAQNTADLPQGEFIPYTLVSGETGNATRDSVVVFDQVVSIPNAVWLRLHFSDAVLSPGSYVRMTALADGGTQILDADFMARWSFTSAYFNGHAVHVELVVAPETSGDQIAIGSVETQIVVPGAPVVPCHENDYGICGDDDRVPSQALWSARFLPSGCTASIYNTSSCAVTAAHCASGSTVIYVLQFNVPNSDENCAMNHPSPVDQFPVTGFLSQFGSPNFNNDWSAMTVGANDQGETPYERYGEFRPIASAPASTTVLAEFWGYGFDNSNPILSQTQQYSSGVILIREDTHYVHDADIIFGSSGGAMIHDGEIIGIQSSASQPDGPCFNKATRVDLPDFVAARDSICVDESPVKKANWGSLKTRYR